MDHFIPATVAQKGLDFTAFVAGDPARIGGRIGDQSAPQIAARGIPDHHQIATLGDSLAMTTRKSFFRGLLEVNAPGAGARYYAGFDPEPSSDERWAYSVASIPIITESNRDPS